MTGGKVRRKPTASSMKATTLIFASETDRQHQNRFSTNHITSQTIIAPVVTPDSVPVGLYILSRRPNAGDASPANASTPRVAQPIPVARIAAAAGPFGDTSRSN